MRQELIDLLLGELEPAEADALKARLGADPDLNRELADLQTLFSLMRRGEEIEPSPGAREVVVAAAARARPPLLARLRELPGLAVYRFRSSVRFRVAMISLAAHLAVIAVLAQILLRAAPVDVPGPFVTYAVEEQRPIEPSPAFVSRVMQRRLPQGPRLRQFGAVGQEEAIRIGLDSLLSRQGGDGSFGDVEETAYATLALLAEGDGSAQPTVRGQAIRAARDHLLAAVEGGARHGAILAALVEDYALSYEDLDEQARAEYARAIGRLLLAVPDDEISREALVLASLAGFAIPAGRPLGEAEHLASNGRAALLAKEPTRLRATAVLARGPTALDPATVRAWAKPLFERAIGQIRAGEASGLVLLTLQAPYRL
jgi:hypothetical protein